MANASAADIAELRSGTGSLRDRMEASAGKPHATKTGRPKRGRGRRKGKK